MADPTKPRRRLQFSLAALFGMMTVWAVWLGWELNYIRERQAVRDLVTKQGGTAMTCADVAEFAVRNEVPYKPASIPFWRRVLGDEAMELYPHSQHRATIARQIGQVISRGRDYRVRYR